MNSVSTTDLLGLRAEVENLRRVMQGILGEEGSDPPTAIWELDDERAIAISMPLGYHCTCVYNTYVRSFNLSICVRSSVGLLNHFASLLLSRISRRS